MSKCFPPCKRGIEGDFYKSSLTLLYKRRDFRRIFFEKGEKRVIYTVLQYNKKLKNLARNLRKSMTDAEILVWSKIRRKQINGMQFYRQKTIGNYIVDLYCPRGKLVVEIDGGQHY